MSMHKMLTFILRRYPYILALPFNYFRIKWKISSDFTFLSSYFFHLIGILSFNTVKKILDVGAAAVEKYIILYSPQLQCIFRDLKKSEKMKKAFNTWERIKNYISIVYLAKLCVAELF